MSELTQWCMGFVLPVFEMNPNGTNEEFLFCASQDCQFTESSH